MYRFKNRCKSVTCGFRERIRRVGAELIITSGDLGIFVDQPTEPIVTSEAKLW